MLFRSSLSLSLSLSETQRSPLPRGSPLPMGSPGLRSCVSSRRRQYTPQAVAGQTHKQYRPSDTQAVHALRHTSSTRPQTHKQHTAFCVSSRHRQYTHGVSWLAATQAVPLAATGSTRPFAPISQRQGLGQARLCHRLLDTCSLTAA